MYWLIARLPKKWQLKILLHTRAPHKTAAFFEMSRGEVIHDSEIYPKLRPGLMVLSHYGLVEQPQYTNSWRVKDRVEMREWLDNQRRFWV